MFQSDKKLVQRVIDETASKKNARSVVEWFSSTIEGIRTLSDMIDRDAYRMEERGSRPFPISPMQSDILLNRIQQTIRRKQIKRRCRKIAAVLLPFLLFVGTLVYLDLHVDLFGKTTYVELYIPRGEKARLFFHDGSEVYLNADTRIRYPKKFGLSKRDVYLTGEAYFKVAPDKKRPFVVHAQNTTVRVLGTSFNLSAYENDKTVRVILDEGSILFGTSLNRHQLVPGQQLVYDKTSGGHLIQTLPKSQQFSLWREGILCFYDTPLPEVLKILERRYDVAFSVKDATVLTYSFTLTTRETDMKNILSELQKIAPLKFTSHKNNVEVSLL